MASPATQCSGVHVIACPSSCRANCLPQPRHSQMVIVIVQFNSDVFSIGVTRRQQCSTTAAAVVQNDIVLVCVGSNQIFAQLNRLLRREDCRVRLVIIQNTLRIFLRCTFSCIRQVLKTTLVVVCACFCQISIAFSVKGNAFGELRIVCRERFVENTYFFVISQRHLVCVEKA